MRTLRIVFAFVLAMPLAITVAAAQQVKQESKEATDQQKTDDDQEKVVMIVSIQDLPLTEEQEAKITAIRKEYGPKFEEAAKKLKALEGEEVEKIRGALTSEQRQKIREIIAERELFKERSLGDNLARLKDLDLSEAELAKIAEIRKEYRPSMEEKVKQLHGLLTDAQKEAREKAVKAGKSRREVLQALNLTTDQASKVEAVAKELKELVQRDVEAIRGVLTEAQQEELQDLKAERRESVRDRLAHRIANVRDLGLTDEQRSKLADIRQEFRPRLHALGNELRASAGEEVGKIMAVLSPQGARVVERPRRKE